MNYQRNIMKFWKKSKTVSEFDSETVFNEKYLKAKTTFYVRKINTNFHDNKISKEDSKFISLSLSLINSVFRTGKSYYPLVFLEECKYVVQEIKMPEQIIDDIEISSDSDREGSDEKISNEENSGEENSSEEN